MIPRLLLPWLVAIASFAAFLPALEADFVNWDDDVNLVDNPGFRGLGWTELRWMLTATLLGHWIPLTWLSFGINYALGGMDPRGYHLGNMLIHAASTGVLFLIGRRLIAAASGRAQEEGIRWAPAVWGAALAAAVFGLHPLRAESVAWVTERRDVLCGLFYLLSVLAYLRGAERAGPTSRRWRLLSLGAFAAALLSKAMAMTLPATLVLLDLYPLRRFWLGWRAQTRDKAPYLALAGLGALVAVIALRRGAVVTGYAEHGPVARMAMVAYSFWFYPAKWIWPSGLSPLYELPERVNPLEWRFVGAALGLVVVTASLLALRRRWPAALSAWTQSAIVLLPVSGVVHAGHQLAHDRYSYLSGLGFALLAGGALAWLMARRQEGRLAPGLLWPAAGVALALLVLLAGATWRQTRVWRDSETLWRHAAAVDPRCAQCVSNLGHAFLAQRRFADAEGAFRRVLELRPSRASTHVNLGVALWRQGRSGEAEAAFREALRVSPGFPDALADLGALQAEQGRFAEAVPLLRQAYQAKPAFVGLRANLGHALNNYGAELARRDGAAAAEPLFREAAGLLASDPGPYRNLGQALVETGRHAEAVEALGRSLALDPRSPQTRFWLGRARALAGDVEGARREIAVLRSLDAGAAEHLERLLADGLGSSTARSR